MKYSRLSLAAFAVITSIVLGASGVTASEKDTLNADDVKFVKGAAAAGMAEIKIAELGAQKATNKEVMDFAKLVASDHSAVNVELKALAADKGVELSSEIDPDHAKTIQKLEMESGAEFDKEFIAVIVSDHKTCVNDFEDATKNASDGAVKTFALKVLPTLKAHLAKAEELAAK